MYNNHRPIVIAFQPRHRPQVAPLAAILRGEGTPWKNDGEALRSAAYHGVDRLLYRALPPDLRRGPIEEVYFRAAAEEMLRAKELGRLTEALTAKGVPFAFIKGTALAYSAYPLPSLRPRVDTDLVVARERLSDLGSVVTALGYEAIVTSGEELLFGQQCFRFRDKRGFSHWLDVHWEVSARKSVARQLSVRDILEGSVPLASLGHGARRAGDLHAMSIACFHPTAHHPGDLRLVWLVDIQYLASRFGEKNWEGFIDETCRRSLAAPAREMLQLAAALLGARVPPEVPAALEKQISGTDPWRRRPRGRRHDLLWDLSHLGMRDRLSLLREVFFPRPEYLFQRHGMRITRLSWLSLPWLYLRRALTAALRGGS